MVEKDWNAITEKKNNNILLNMAINRVAENIDLATTLKTEENIEDFQRTVLKYYEVIKKIHEKAERDKLI